MTEPLDAWIERQYPLAAAGMLASVSPVHVVKQRPGFGQSIRPRRGAIVASPVLAAYDPDPDYFFHWYRDSALVVDALRLLLSDAVSRDAALAHFEDFVDFSLALGELDGRSLHAEGRWRAAVAPQFERFVRPEEQLQQAYGEAIGGETRVNPDGGLDISLWPRPQHDGPALRALTLLRWAASATLPGPLRAAVARLLRADLTYTLRHAREPCFDIWEEEHALHYYTVRVACAALEQGADWLEQQPDEADQQQARACRHEVQALHAVLEGFWSPEEGLFRSRLLPSGSRSAKELDIAVLLATLHAGSSASRHSVRDARMHATLRRLEALFDTDYAINHGRPATLGPAMGRYHGDVYYSGGAYYFSTLGAAEFCFDAARLCADAADAAALTARGDAYLATVQRFTPPSGQMSEQFDQRSGEQSSAKQLSWSYAAFLSCVAARRAATQP